MERLVTLGCATSGQACPCQQRDAQPAGVLAGLGMACLGCAAAAECGAGPARAMGDLSFDGTGILGTGLFGYQPWYDTSQWTPIEWAAAAAAAFYLVKGVKWGKRAASDRRDKQAKRR